MLWAKRLFLRRRLERELDQELRFHLDRHTADLIARGLDPDEALRQARLALGGPEQVKEHCRDARGTRWIEDFAQDFRYALRTFRQRPGFAVVAVFTLALGIGATTAMFSVVYGVLLRPLPYPKPDQIVRLWEVDGKGRRMNFTDPNFEDVRAQNHSLQGLAEYAWWPASVTGGSLPTRTFVAWVSRDFFAIMDVEPVLGRGFRPDDQLFGAAPAALVSYGYWKQYLGGAVDLSQTKLRIEGHSLSVIGVLPAGFRFPGSDIWVPRELEERLPSRSAHNWHVIGRLKDGLSPGQAHVEISAIARLLKQRYGRDIDMVDAAIERLEQAETSQARPALLILLGAVALLLLIACVNVVNLLMAQAAARGRELAIRAALGAERRRLMKQFLTEALLLSLVGGAFGVLGALWGVSGLLALAPSNLPRMEEVALNTPVLLFALAVSVTVAAGLGLITAMRATGADPQPVLAEAGRDQAGTARGRHLGAALVSAQLAVTLVLLVGAGLLARSLLRVLSVDPGFRTDHVVTVDLALPSVELEADKVRRVRFLNELFARLRAIPGVQEVGSTSSLPLSSDAFFPDGTYVLMSPSEPVPRMEDLQRLFHETSRTGHADYFAVSEGYFRVLGIPLLRGRLFDDRDTADAPHAALISESLAREKWPDQDPLGHAIEFGNMDRDLRPLTVVGVVGDVRTSLEELPRPAVYVNYRQRAQAIWNPSIVLRSDADAAAILPTVRQIVHELDPDVPPSFRTFTQVFSASLRTRRFNLILAGIFAATALLLAVAGIYGVMAYSVARRTREIGVRMALGSSRRTVLLMVLGQSMRTAAAGIVAGIAGALALTRAMATLLFGVSATDPATFAGIALLLATISALACFIPARRATRVDPIVALRCE